MSKTVIELQNIRRDFQVGDETVHALRGVSFSITEGEFVTIMGTSGSGKSTLLNTLGCLDTPTSGEYLLDGISVRTMSKPQRAILRNRKIGFVFQSYNLLAKTTAVENVELPLMYNASVSAAERRQRAIEALQAVGLGDRLEHKSNQMSGGQMQRVAIARALINDPEILLADEPTGALDTETSVQIMDLLKEIAKDRLVIMVTHNPELAEQYSTRIVKLLDGEITDDSMPYSDEEAAKETYEELSKKDLKHKRMSYFTALNLSFNNLLTKKGRTLLTAFAGSIGIIGIALILSLSDGFRNYIKSVEEDTLSTYPLEITDESIDMSAMMGIMLGTEMKSEEEHDMDKVYSNNFVGNYMKNMLGEVKVNDMVSFKDYIEEGDGQKMKDYTSDIMYTYGITINAYKSDVEKEVYQVNPSTVFDSIGFGSMSEMDNLGMTGTQSTTNVWSEMISNQELLENQYDVVAGRWPENYDEVVMVVTKDNEISDYELYSLGIRDVSEMQEMMRAALKGETKTYPNTSYTYDDLLSLTYKVIPSSDFYEYDDSEKCYVDKSDDADYLKDKIKNGLDIKVVGIVRPNEDATVHSITTTIGYTHALVEKLMDLSRDSEVGKAQLDDPDKNVFTGYEFGADLNEEAQKEAEQQAQDAMSEMGIADMTEDQLYEYMASLPADQLKQFMQTMTEQTQSVSNSMSLSDLKSAENATYDDNLVTLGIAYENDPKVIRIYPIDFESKEKIIDVIEEYNDMVKANGEEEKEISYTDMVGTMMSSISTIINAISYVLMAFVAISLVVSSIMIGIITYISVLERTKEIGVLRSIGASKKDISRVFNAETIIIGFVAGLIGIGVTVLLNIPINAVIHHFAGLTGVAKLPVTGGALLVAISVVLTMIGGLIPSRVASKKDPVEALRSE